MIGKRANMANPKPLTNDEGEVRELTGEDLTRAVPFSALPAELQALLFSPKHVSPDPEIQSATR
jgi:hypothetical protein